MTVPSFDVGEYFSGRGVESFYSRVSIDFAREFGCLLEAPIELEFLCGRKRLEGREVHTSLVVRGD